MEDSNQHISVKKTAILRHWLRSEIASIVSALPVISMLCILRYLALQNNQQKSAGRLVESIQMYNMYQDENEKFNELIQKCIDNGVIPSTDFVIMLNETISYYYCDTCPKTTNPVLLEMNNPGTIEKGMDRIKHCRAIFTTNTSLFKYLDICLWITFHYTMSPLVLFDHIFKMKEILGCVEFYNAISGKYHI